MINMLNSEQNHERALRFAMGKLDDRFCTGAGLIIYRMRRLLRLALGEVCNKNTFPLAFKFLLAKFVTLDLDFKPLRHQVTKQHKAILVKLCVLLSLSFLLKFWIKPVRKNSITFIPIAIGTKSKT